VNIIRVFECRKCIIGNIITVFRCRKCKIISEVFGSLSLPLIIVIVIVMRSQN
jgi:hypothetical protein